VVLLVAVGYAALTEIVGRQLNLYAVSLEDTYIVLSHLSGEICQNFMAVFQFDTESGVGKDLADQSFYFNRFFCHSPLAFDPSWSLGTIARAQPRSNDATPPHPHSSRHV